MLSSRGLSLDFLSTVKSGCGFYENCVILQVLELDVVSSNPGWVPSELIANWFEV